MKSLVFAGGCFWGVEAYFRQIEGVIFTEVGYVNGNTIEPSYEEVCSNSGHAEAVEVYYDTNIINTKRLVELFFDIIDPVAINKQGNDVGVQYRTGIYYMSNSMQAFLEKQIENLEENIGQPVAVEIEAVKNFYRAEEEHQNYLANNPNGYCHIPKEKLSSFITA